MMMTARIHSLQLEFRSRPQYPHFRGIRVSENPKSTSSPSRVFLFFSNSSPVSCHGLHRSQFRRCLAGVSQSKATSESDVCTAGSLRLPTASEVVRDFYDGINRRDLESVESLIGMECVYEDLIFLKPFVGRKRTTVLMKTAKQLDFTLKDLGKNGEFFVSTTRCCRKGEFSGGRRRKKIIYGLVYDYPTFRIQDNQAIMEFFKKFTESISSELQFVIDDISTEDKSTAGVTWHLEWRGRLFPFSKGCSFYRLEVSEGTRKIIYARDCVEPAVKPGTAALAIISAVTWLLQRFPQLADRL